MSLHTKGPTLQEMAATWERRKRSNWPATFQETMEHPLYSRILMIEAIRIALNGLKRSTPAPASEAAKPHAVEDRRGYWMDTDKGVDTESGPL